MKTKLFYLLVCCTILLTGCNNTNDNSIYESETVKQETMTELEQQETVEVKSSYFNTIIPEDFIQDSNYYNVYYKNMDDDSTIYLQYFIGQLDKEPNLQYLELEDIVFYFNDTISKNLIIPYDTTNNYIRFQEEQKEYITLFDNQAYKISGHLQGTEESISYSAYYGKVPFTYYDNKNTPICIYAFCNDNQENKKEMSIVLDNFAKNISDIDIE